MNIYLIGSKGIPAKSGGVERHVENLAIGLAKMGHSIFVYSHKTYTGKFCKSYKGVNIVYLPTIKSKNFEAAIHVFLSTIHVLFRKADIIQYDSIGPALFLWIPKMLKPQSKIIFEFHSQDYFHQKWGFFARAMLRLGELIGCKFADEVIVTSTELAKYVRKQYGRETRVVRSIMQAKQDLSKTGSLSPIVIVSRIVRHKGIHYLVEAFRKSLTKRELWIVGKSSFTDSYFQDLKSLAGGDKRIKFLGEKNGKALDEIYRKAAIVVQPSNAEGLSLVLLEAMSHGKIIIASDIKPNREALGDAGIYFKNGSITDLHKKLVYTSSNLNRLSAKAKRALDRIGRYYSGDEDMLRKVYQA